MSGQKNKTEKIFDIKPPVAQVFFVIVSFLLAALDMIFLYKAIQNIMFRDRGMAMGVAFIIATIANFTALMWGYENGRNMSKRLINKQSSGYFITWALIGCFYAAIRAINIAKGNGSSVSSEILQAVILGISYIGTGTLISSAMRRIADHRRTDARKYQKRFASLHEEVIAESAEIQKLTDTLRDYGLIYKSLDKQYNIIKKGIYREEKSQMSTAAGKIIESNRHISANLVYAIMDEFLENRKNDKTKDI